VQNYLRVPFAGVGASQQAYAALNETSAQQQQQQHHMAFGINGPLTRLSLIADAFGDGLRGPIGIRSWSRKALSAEEPATIHGTILIRFWSLGRARHLPAYDHITQQQEDG
jgi:hypothetical protein